MRRSIPMIYGLLFVTILAGCSGKKQVKSLGQEFTAATKIQDPQARGNRLVRLAYDHHEAGDVKGAETCLDAATQAAEKITDNIEQCQLLHYAAFGFGKLGFPAKAKKTLAGIRTAADQIEQPERRVAVLARMAEVYERFLESQNAAKNLLEEAEQLTTHADLPDSKVRLLMEVAYYHSRLKHDQDVERIVNLCQAAVAEVREPRAKADALTRLAAGLARIKSDATDSAFQSAAEATSRIQDPLSRGHTWLAIAKALMLAGREEEAQQTLGKAKSAADKVTDSSLRDPLLQQINGAFSKK